jgi:hypothetical protein
VKEKDKKAFLDDFKNAEVEKKLDMWYFAIDQEAFWEEIISEMSEIANPHAPLQKTIKNE